MSNNYFFVSDNGVLYNNLSFELYTAYVEHNSYVIKDCNVDWLTFIEFLIWDFKNMFGDVKVKILHRYVSDDIYEYKITENINY